MCRRREHATVRRLKIGTSELMPDAPQVHCTNCLSLLSLCSRCSSTPQAHQASPQRRSSANQCRAVSRSPVLILKMPPTHLQMRDLLICLPHRAPVAPLPPLPLVPSLFQFSFHLRLQRVALGALFIDLDVNLVHGGSNLSDQRVYPRN